MTLAYDDMVARLRLDDRFVGLDRKPVRAARALADALLSRWDKPWNAPNNGKCLAIFVVLVRAAGVDLDPRFDRLLPVPSGEDWMDGVVDECLAALPEARRTAAARAAIQRERGSVAVAGGLRMLERIPDVEIAKHVIKESKTCEIAPYTLSRVRPKLEKLARKHPQLAPALGGKAPPSIEVLAVRTPTRVDELSDLERSQLTLAAKKYDGKRVPIERRFGPDDGSESSFGRTLLLVTLGEKGVPTHDAVLFAGDAGSVFRHGTTKEVAARIQGSLEARNADLASRLDDALSRAERAGHQTKKAPASKAPKKPVATAASASKPAKKAGAKKAGAKKAGAKKAGARKAGAKKAGARKATSTKPAAKKPAAKKPSAKK